METRTLETSRSLARTPPRKGSARGGKGVTGTRLPLLTEQRGESPAPFSETKSNKGIGSNLSIRQVRLTPRPESFDQTEKFRDSLSGFGRRKRLARETERPCFALPNPDQQFPLAYDL